MLKISESSQTLLRCPLCSSTLNVASTYISCNRTTCGATFPVVDSIPILINEKRSLFTIEDFSRDRLVLFGSQAKSPSRLRRIFKSCLPTISKNVRARENLLRLASLVKRQSENPKILIVGGGFEGEGIGELSRDSTIEIVETDVSFGPKTKCICDAHDLPFAEGSFDGVIVQAVLEHVLDPQRCAEEIHRVLKMGALVYAETPFIQQVHGGRYDFTRYTHLGHRRLFRDFIEVDSGATCGPGMALAWTYQHFLLSFSNKPRPRRFLQTFAILTSFYLKYFDRFLLKGAGGFMAASVYFFLGSKSSTSLSDKELISAYKGVDRVGR